MRRNNAGAVLLEVIVATVILSVAGVAAVTMAASAARAVESARDADRSLRDASDFMEAIALWTRADLDRRLGERPQGPWRLRLDRPAPELYTVVLTDTLTGAELLRTALFRMDTARAFP